MILKNLRVRCMSGIISTDDIIPAVYKHSSTDSTELARFVFSNYKPGFAETIKPEDILVCDQLAGIGSSREQAVTALKAAGFRAILAPAFGRIFYRNCWNNAFPALCIDKFPVQENDLISIDMTEGTIRREADVFIFEKPSEFLLKIMEDGGLLEHYKITTIR